MKKIKYYILLVLISIITSKVSAQVELDKSINWNSFDTHLLHEAFNNRINFIRDSLKLHKLEQDEVLDKAALLQANFCLKSNKTTDLQSNKKFKTVNERVIFYDGDHEQVAENVGYYQETSKIDSNNASYNSIANSVLKSWLKSKNGNKNFSNPLFYHSGLQFAFNSKTKKLYVVLVFGTLPLTVEGKHSPANAYNIGAFRSKDCKSCKEAIDSLFKTQINFGIIEKDGKAVLMCSDIDYFKKVFSGNYYFSADLIMKQQFACDKPTTLHCSPYHDGYLFKPISKSAILKNNLSKDGAVFSVIGEIPFNLLEQYELNLVVLKKRSFSSIKSHCFTLIQSPSYGFNLSILPPAFKADYDNNNDSVIVKKKELKFEIPFKKDKYEYSQEDIRAFIDSLNLNKFNITKINLTAYASVEGDSLYNLNLQKKRAESIVKAFQSVQDGNIRTKITTFENWQAFKKDIKNTNHSNLLLLSKAEIKKELKNDTIARDLESILASHRKAVVKLQTEEKITYNFGPEEIFKQYQAALNDSLMPIKNKILIQKKLFGFIVENKFEISNLINAPIKENASNMKLINNQIALKYQINKELPNFYQLQEYEKLAKNDLPILFGIYSLMVQHWYSNQNISIDYNKLKRGIENLYERSVIDDGEYYKLMMSYNIAAANYFKIRNDFKQEKKAVKFISSYYENAVLTNKEAYILANFFVYHKQYKNAINLLVPRVNATDIDEDVLFYYLSLAVYQNSQTEKDDFDQKLEKALELNKERFCKLFGYPALSFQLMKDGKMKNQYCESCQGVLEGSQESIQKQVKEGENRIEK